MILVVHRHRLADSHLLDRLHARGDDSEYARYFSYLNLFAAFMLVLVLGANFLVMFVGWEGVGLCSYLLIGFWYRKKSASDAGKKAFIVNRIGDFGSSSACWRLRRASARSTSSRSPAPPPRRPETPFGPCR
jgi:NADH:ubiquinone oxidoreductase subunit 5 (subunit L)/multisubunit Na+/H+ antiporter MnhA subunit